MKKIESNIFSFYTFIKQHKMSSPSFLYIYTPIVGCNKSSYFNVKKIYTEKEKVIQASRDEPNAFFEVFILNSVGEYEPTGQYYRVGCLLQHYTEKVKILHNRSL
jgi:hypothetical protein